MKLSDNLLVVTSCHGHCRSSASAPEGTLAGSLFSFFCLHTPTLGPAPWTARALFTHPHLASNIFEQSFLIWLVLSFCCTKLPWLFTRITQHSSVRWWHGSWHADLLWPIRTPVPKLADCTLHPSDLQEAGGEGHGYKSLV